MKIAILLSCCFLSLAAHQLKYNSTLVKPKQTFTVVVELDGQQILHWDSNTMKMVPDTEWMKNVALLEKSHWNTETNFTKKEEEDLEYLLPEIMNHVQQSEGTHSLSQIHGCQINEGNEKGSGFKQYNYDKEEFLRLNLTSITWTPANDEAQKFLNKKGWDKTKAEADRWKKVLEVDCIKSLQLYVKYNMSQVSPKAEGFEPLHSSLDSESQNRRDGVSSGVIVGVVMGLLVLVLVLVGGGMVLWKKRNSGFKKVLSGSVEGGVSD